MYTGNIIYLFDVLQFSFEIKGQNLFPDNHWGGGGVGGNNVCE